MTDILEPLTEIVEGWTSKIGPFLISLNGAALNLTGLTVTMVLRRASGQAVTPGGAIEVLDQTVLANRGKVNYTPVAADFAWEPLLYTVHQPYELHWKIVDGAGKVAFSPSGAPAIVMVHRA